MTIELEQPTPAELLAAWRRRGPTAQDIYPLQAGKRYVAMIVELDSEASMSTIEDALETNFSQVTKAKGIAEYTTLSGIPENTEWKAQIRLRIRLYDSYPTPSAVV